MVFKQIIQISQIPGQEIASGYEDNLYIDDFDEKCKIHKETIEFSLKIFGESILFRIDVIPGMIKLSELVPLARELSSQISTIIHKKATKTGICIPCRKGCSACCNYLVPLSIPEAFQLRNEVLSMPENIRRAVFNLFLASAGIILKHGAENLYLMELDQLSKWYSQLNLTCPFLSDNICGIYDRRPIACREHLVTNTNLFCNPFQQNDFNKIDLPVSILECLGKLSSELRRTEVEAIMMPLALLWTEENPDSDMYTWPSIDIVRRFTEIIKESFEKSNSVLDCH